MTTTSQTGATMFSPFPFHARELAALHVEIARYLAAVDLFCREGCVPAWRPESRG